MVEEDDLDLDPMSTVLADQGTPCVEEPGSSQCRLNFIFQGNPSKMVPIDSAWHFHSSCKVSADLES